MRPAGLFIRDPLSNLMSFGYKQRRRAGDPDHRRSDIFIRFQAGDCHIDIVENCRFQAGCPTSGVPAVRGQAGITSPLPRSPRLGYEQIHRYRNRLTIDARGGQPRSGLDTSAALDL
jgi:hypothetical protein